VLDVVGEGPGDAGADAVAAFPGQFDGEVGTALDEIAVVAAAAVQAVVAAQAVEAVVAGAAGEEVGELIAGEDIGQLVAGQGGQAGGGIEDSGVDVAGQQPVAA
jgi:hypothetical protein